MSNGMGVEKVHKDDTARIFEFVPIQVYRVWIYSRLLLLLLLLLYTSSFLAFILNLFIQLSNYISKIRI